MNNFVLLIKSVFHMNNLTPSIINTKYTMFINDQIYLTLFKSICNQGKTVLVCQQWFIFLTNAFSFFSFFVASLFFLVVLVSVLFFVLFRLNLIFLVFDIFFGPAAILFCKTKIISDFLPPQFVRLTNLGIFK